MKNRVVAVAVAIAVGVGGGRRSPISSCGFGEINGSSGRSMIAVKHNDASDELVNNWSGNQLGSSGSVSGIGDEG